MPIRIRAVGIALCVPLPGLVSSSEADNLKSAIQAIRQVGPDAKGSAEAAQAWRTLAAAQVEQLPLILGGMDGATPLARNWLRSAVDEVVDQAQRAKKPL